MAKRATESERLRVYFTYPFDTGLPRGRRSDVLRIRRALNKMYTVIESPSRGELKKVRDTADLETIYDSVRKRLKGADLVLAYLPDDKVSPVFMNELMMAVGLGKKVAVVGSRSIRKKLEPLLAEAVSRTFDSPEELIKRGISPEVGKQLR